MKRRAGTESRMIGASSLLPSGNLNDDDDNGK